MNKNGLKLLFKNNNTLKNFKLFDFQEALFRMYSKGCNSFLIILKYNKLCVYFLKV